MNVGLFIPCYIEQFYPQVAIATLQVLEKHGVNVSYPLSQTCCGQPMANSGFEHKSKEVYNQFCQLFGEYDYIVTPSASCAYHVKHHYDILEQSPEVKHIRTKTFELIHFLIEILKVNDAQISFPYQVGLHLSCHGQRGLRNANSSEITSNKEGEILKLLRTVKDIKLTELDRNDECCGFGGTFCIAEDAVSSRMGIDRIQDHIKNGTTILTSGDMSCLMHLDGIIKRQKLPIKVMHIAEILNYETI